MDLAILREIVDDAGQGISACGNELSKLYEYVGLEPASSMQRSIVSDALYANIRKCFSSGQRSASLLCRDMLKELIQEHVLEKVPLQPYFEVLQHLEDALRSAGKSDGEICGDWRGAVLGAADHVSLQSFGDVPLHIAYPREYNVAMHARFLRDNGFSVKLTSGCLCLEEASERALASMLEDTVARAGGINVARRIFGVLSETYDASQQRYHVIRSVSMSGLAGSAQVPWGYLIQLSVKHLNGRKPYNDTDYEWSKLCRFAQAYAAVLDVQPYVPTFFGFMNAKSFIPHLQDMALYDTLFCIPQIRPTDVPRIMRGILCWLDLQQPLGNGWSIADYIEVIEYLLCSEAENHQPVILKLSGTYKALPHIPNSSIKNIVNDVLSHGAGGANQGFSLLTDAPSRESKKRGIDFYLRPLLHIGGNKFVLLNRSLCAPACIEALLAYLRTEIVGLDEKIGLAIEAFLISEFSTHGVEVKSGEYDSKGRHGECDLVVESEKDILFFEIKKKSFTRLSKSGSDVSILLDLAGSLVGAQSQAGWHEVCLRQDKFLALKRGNSTSKIYLSDRGIERIAVSLFDYGSFQDRMILSHFLNAAIRVEFLRSSPGIENQFDSLNKSLAAIRTQLDELYAMSSLQREPFFHCWFISVPQVLILLDGTTSNEDFKRKLWSSRHMSTGSQDLYFELHCMTKLEGK